MRWIFLILLMVDCANPHHLIQTHTRTYPKVLVVVYIIKNVIHCCIQTYLHIYGDIDMNNVILKRIISATVYTHQIWFRFYEYYYCFWYNWAIKILSLTLLKTTFETFPSVWKHPQIQRISYVYKNVNLAKKDVIG